MKSSEEIKRQAEALHANYIQLTNEAIESYKAEPKDNTVMKDYFLKKSSEYISKAEAIYELINFIGY